MMKYGKKIVAIAALSAAALAFAPAAMAADDAGDDGGPALGLFFGPQIGVSIHDGEDGAGIGELGDTTQVAWGLNAWFRPSPYGAISLGYIDLGDDLNGFHTTLTPMFPIGDSGFSVFGTIGLLVETGDDSERDTWTTYGGGVLCDDITIAGIDHFGARLDYERYDDEDVVDSIILSFFYQFGFWGPR
jgi:hypothetical protein